MLFWTLACLVLVAVVICGIVTMGMLRATQG